MTARTGEVRPFEPPAAANNGMEGVARVRGNGTAETTLTRVAARAGVVPVDREMLSEQRVILPDEASAAAHAYRMLRTQTATR